MDVALTVDMAARRGAGHRRTVVLGGGGIFFIAWQVAFLNELARQGLVLRDATRFVGTSAGSIVAAIYTGGGIGRFARTMDVLSRAPGVVAALAPAGDLSPSQLRALDSFTTATDCEPETIREIGRAAMAAAAAPASAMRRTARLTIVRRGWPDRSLAITAVDTYTGERLVIDHRAGVPVATAAAASGTVPGLFSPQLIHDRFCMDGGVAGSGIHSDLVAGSQRTLILSLSEAFRALGPRPGGMTQAPGAYDRELDALRESGTEAFVVGPETADMTTLMEPRSVPDALAMGTRQARERGRELADFWR